MAAISKTNGGKQLSEMCRSVTCNLGFYIVIQPHPPPTPGWRPKVTELVACYDKNKTGLDQFQDCCKSFMAIMVIKLL